MTDTNMQILQALETLAEAFPWDTCQIEISRKPQGDLSFRAWILSNEKLGFGCELAIGDRVADAVARLIEEQAGKRDPDLNRKRKIAELQMKIEQLQSVVIGIPPYKPNRELARINLPAAPITVDV